MVDIRNTVTTDVKTRGAKQSAAQIDNLGNKFNRLTGASGNTTKSFSKQSAGLGGLVGAYAGAAATVFALQQAFSALNRAAVAEQTIQGTIALGAAIGESGDQILKSVVEITKGQLTLAEAAENTNIALSAGFNSEQIERLTAVSLKASRALGRNLTDALQRVLRGSAKLEPELLDELGIFTRIEPAVQKYSQALGKNATALTSFERRQAFVNAVIEEGERKFSSISTTASTSAESLEKFSAVISQIALDIGSFLADIVAPLANFISGNFSNAFAVVAVAGILIFKKALDLLSGGLQTFAEKRVAAATEKLEQFIATNPKAVKSIEAVNKSIVKLRSNFLKGATRKETIALKELGVAGNITAQELDRVKKVTEKQIVATQKRITQEKGIAQNTLKSNEQRTKATAAIANQTKELRTQQGLLKKTDTAIKSIDAAALKGAQSAGRLSRGLQAVSGAVTKAVNAFFLFTIALAAVVFIVNKVIDLLDLRFVVDSFVRDFLEATKALFGFTEAAKQVKEGLEGIATGTISNNIKAIAGDLKDFTNLIFEKQGGGLFGGNIFVTREISDFQESLVDGLKDITTARNQLSAAQALEGNTVQAAKGRKQLIDETTAALAEETTAVQNLTSKLTGLSAESVLVIQAVDAAIKQALDIGEFAGNFAFLSATIGKSVDDLVKRLNVAKEGFTTFDLAGESNLFGDLPAIQVKSFKQIRAEAEIISKLLGEDQVESAKTLAILVKQEQASSKLVGARVLAVELEEQLNRGLLSSEGISSRLISLQTLLTAAKKLGFTIDEDGKKVQSFIVVLLEEQVEKLKLIANLQIEIETVTGQIRKTFASQIAAADKLTGIVNLQGKLATTELEKRTFQIALLRESLVVSEDAVRKQKEGIELSGDEQKLVTQALSAEKAIAGLVFKAITDLKKINEELTKRLEKEIAIGEANNRKAIIKSLQLEIKLQATIQRGKEQELKRTQDLLKIERKISDLKNIKGPEFEREKTAKRQLELSKNNLEQAKGPLDFLSSDRLKTVLEIRIEKQSLDILVNSIKSQIAALQLDGQRRKNDLGTEIAAIEKQIKFNKEQADREDTLALARKDDALASAKASEEAKLLEVAKIKENAIFLRSQAQLLEFHVTGLDTVLANHVAGLQIALKQTGQQRDVGETAADFRKRVASGIKVNVGADLTKQIEDQSKKALKGAVDLENQIILNGARQRIFIAGRFIAEGKIAEANRENVEEELKGKQLIAAATVELIDLQIAQQVAEKEEEILIAKKAAAAKILILKREQDTFFRLANKISDSLESTIGAGIKELTVDVINGTKTMKDAFRDMFNNIIVGIQEAVTEELIINPLKELAKDSLNSIFGDLFGGAKNDGSSIGSPLWVKDANNPLGKVFGGDSIKESLLGPGEFNDTDFLESFGEKAKTEGTTIGTVFTKIFDGIKDLGKGIIDVFSAAAKGISSLFTGGAGFLSSLFGSGLSGSAGQLGSGLGGGGFGDFSNTFGGGGDLFDFIGASGGRVQRFAAGGSVRDSVPALLEPGEFVLKKSAARDIGNANLQKMNAGMGSTPNVQLIMNNDGQEKEEQKPPRVQVTPTEIIVEVFLKDLASNGPIRQGIRGAR